MPLWNALMHSGKKDKIQEICLLDVGANSSWTLELSRWRRLETKWRQETNGDKMETKTKMTEMETNGRTIGDETKM